MRDVDADFLATVASSHTRLVEVNVWRGGSVIAQRVPVTAGTISFDSDADMTRMSEGVSIASADNSLTPLNSDSPLAPYGQRLEVRAGAIVAGEPRLVRLGFLAVQSADPTEQYYRDGMGVMQRSPSVVSVDADDLMQVINEASFLTPEQPPAGATCLSEIRRLVGTRLPVGSFDGVTDQYVPSTITYDDGQGGRLKAIQGLAAACDAACRVDDDGYLVVVPRARKTTPSLTLYTAGTPDGRGGQIVTLRRSMSRDRVYNAVVARGEAAVDTAPLQAIAYDTQTDAQWGSVFGEKPYTFNSPILTTQAAVDQAAATRMNNLIGGRDYQITVDVVPNPAVEIDDCVRLVTPFEEFTGVIRSIRFPLTVAGLMSVTLSVLVGDIATVDHRGPA